MTANVCIYQKVSAEIIALISKGKLVAGDKAPSVNDIRKKYKISHITALRVLQELAKENYLEFVMGKGYYVKAESNSRISRIKGVIGCITRTFRETTIHDNYFNEINQGIQNQAMQKNFNVLYPACNLRFRPMNVSGSNLAEIRNAIEKMKDTVDGFIFDERIPDDVISEIMGRINNPFVVVNRTSSLPIDTVTADNAGGAKEAAGFTIKLGYEHFILFKDEKSVSNHDLRFTSFLSTLVDKNIRKENIDIIEGIFIQPLEVTISKLKKALKKNRNLKKLIFALSDNIARPVSEVLIKEGLTLGENTGLLGFDGMDCARMKKPFLSTVEINPAKIGALAADILIDRINNSHLEAPGNHVVSVNFSAGETI